MTQTRQNAIFHQLTCMSYICTSQMQFDDVQSIVVVSGWDITKSTIFLTSLIDRTAGRSRSAKPKLLGILMDALVLYFECFLTTI